jgi:hypothetical protein
MVLDVKFHSKRHWAKSLGRFFGEGAAAMPSPYPLTTNVNC